MSRPCRLTVRDAFAQGFGVSGQAAMLTEPSTYARLLGPVAVDPPRAVRPLSGIRAQLGFPSPAEDFLEDEIDLNEFLIRNPPATFHYRAEGWSMLMAGICSGDILLVDRSVTPQDGDVVVASWDGNEPTCKVLKLCSDHIELHSRNPHCPNIVLPKECEPEIFAVVGVVRQMKRSGNVRAR
jgi:DNA polymerase V